MSSGCTAWLPSESVGQRRLLRRPRDGRLVAAAGTHVISPTTGSPRSATSSPTATIAAAGIAKVVDERRDRGAAALRVDKVVLNVRSDNPPALAAYRALGYREHMPLRGAPRPPSRDRSGIASSRPSGAISPTHGVTA